MHAAILVVILGLVMGWAQAEAPKPSADEKALLDLEQRWLDASIADDPRSWTRSRATASRT